MSTITLTAFRWVPPIAQGLVKDLRVRWALEEAGLSYQTRLIGPEDQGSHSYRQQQPFGQVPVLEEDGLSLFESGAIVLHIADRSEALCPADVKGRERMRVWAFAALTSIEPMVAALAQIDLFYPDDAWAKQRRPGALDMLTGRLQKLSQWLEGRDYLEDRFTAGDLLMTAVLRDLRHIDLLATTFPDLDAYRKRCEARPAFQKALADQMAVFAAHAP